MGYVTVLVLTLNLLRLLIVAVGGTMAEIPMIETAAPSVPGAPSGQTSCFIFFSCDEGGFWAAISRGIAFFANMMIMVINFVGVVITVPISLFLLDIPTEIAAVGAALISATNTYFLVKLIRGGGE